MTFSKIEMERCKRILSIPNDAHIVLDDLNRFYRAQVNLYHPDLNKTTNKEKIVQINAAYEYLKKHFDKINSDVENDSQPKGTINDSIKIIKKSPKKTHKAFWIIFGIIIFLMIIFPLIGLIISLITK